MPKHKISSLIAATTLFSLTIQYKELVNDSDAQTDMRHKLKGCHLAPRSNSVLRARHDSKKTI